MNEQYIFKKVVLLISSFLIGTVICKSDAYSQSRMQNLDNYNFESNADHFGFQFGLGAHTGQGTKINTEGSVSAKALASPLIYIGTYYQYHFLKNTYVKGGLDLGINSHRFAYALYTPKSDTTWATFDKPTEKVSLNTPVFRVSIGLGQRFYITEKHLLEVQASFIIEKYLTNNLQDTWDTVKSNTVLSNTDKIENLISERSYWGKDRWGSTNGEIYIGYRHRGHDNLTDRFSIGLFYCFSVDNRTQAYSTVAYYDNKYKYESGKERLIKNNAAIGLRASFDLF